jgi:hypothetical protein
MQNFAHRAPLNFMLFVAVGLLVLVFASIPSPYTL